MSTILALVLLVGSAIAPAPTLATCASSTGPGIPPPARVSAGIGGFHAAWYGQSGYLRLCPGERGMAESLAYRSLVAGGRIPAANMDVFAKRQLRTARFVTLKSLETTWPSDANPFAAAYLAVDRLLAVPDPTALRRFCASVGAGEA